MSNSTTHYHGVIPYFRCVPEVIDKEVHDAEPDDKNNGRESSVISNCDENYKNETECVVNDFFL